MKKSYFLTTHTIFKDCSILDYFKITLNFCLMSNKLVKLHFLESALECPKTGQK